MRKTILFCLFVNTTFFANEMSSLYEAPYADIPMLKEETLGEGNKLYTFASVGLVGYIPMPGAGISLRKGAWSFDCQYQTLVIMEAVSCSFSRVLYLDEVGKGQYFSVGVGPIAVTSVTAAALGFRPGIMGGVTVPLRYGGVVHRWGTMLCDIGVECVWFGNSLLENRVIIEPQLRFGWAW